jgi:hypothetical protein
MSGDRGVAAALDTAHMAGHPLPRMETLDGGSREPDILGLMYQGGEDTVVVALDLERRIDIHSGDPPLGPDVKLGRQWLQGRAEPRSRTGTADSREAF